MVRSQRNVHTFVDVADPHTGTHADPQSPTGGSKGCTRGQRWRTLDEGRRACSPHGKEMVRERWKSDAPACMAGGYRYRKAHAWRVGIAWPMPS